MTNQYIVHWVIEGFTEVKAETLEEAQTKFDDQEVDVWEDSYGFEVKSVAQCSRTRAERALPVLNGISDEEYKEQPWWDLKVQTLAGFDAETTRELDKLGSSAVVAFVDGSAAEYVPSLGTWRILMRGC